MSHDRSPRTLIWIDAREALILRYVDGAITFERVPSAVPPHRRSSEHVRHDPATRHGGGAAATAGEPRRLEYLSRFVHGVAALISPTDDLMVLGPGTVREQLRRRLLDEDERHHNRRTIATEAATRMTHRQLAALLRRQVAEASAPAARPMAEVR